MSLALRIGLERGRAATAQAVRQEKVQDQHVVGLEALHGARVYGAHVFAHDAGAEVFLEKGVGQPGAAHDAHIGALTLVATARCGNLCNSLFRHGAEFRSCRR